MNGYLSLNRLAVNECGRVAHLNATDAMHKRLMDMGLVVGTTVKCIGVSPLGDPKAYLIRGAVIAIRNCDGEDISVTKEAEVEHDGT